MLFLFTLEVVVVSIIASLLATWIRLVPRYPKRSQMFIQQLINTVLLTIALIVIEVFGIYPSWIVLLVMIIAVIWLSVQIANKVVYQAGGPMSKDHGSDQGEGVDQR